LLEIVADLAFIFHWSEADILDLPIESLLSYHDKAIERWKTQANIMSMGALSKSLG
jgi:hypothetical protein